MKFKNKLTETVVPENKSVIIGKLIHSALGTPPLHVAVAP
jgi:hypothetical protein